MNNNEGLDGVIAVMGIIIILLLNLIMCIIHYSK
jgi:hypothetical protein